MDTTWRRYAVAVIRAIAVYVFLPTAGRSLLYDAIGLSAGGAVLLGARRHQPARHAAYTLLAFGVLGLIAGDIAFGTGQSVPSSADLLYMSAYPVLALGIYGAVPRRGSARREPSAAINVAVAVTVDAPGGLIDAAWLGAYLCFGIALLHPALAREQATHRHVHDERAGATGQSTPAYTPGSGGDRHSGC